VGPGAGLDAEAREKILSPLPKIEPSVRKLYLRGRSSAKTKRDESLIMSYTYTPLDIYLL
jgi:hypothetical protein